MKKLLIATFLLVPSFVFAAPFVKDSYIATNTTATSSFGGNFSVAGKVQFSGLGDGILSIFNGLLSTINVQAPLSLVDNVLNVGAAGSHNEIQFNDEGNLAGKSTFYFDRDAHVDGTVHAEFFRPRRTYHKQRLYLP